MPTTPPPTETSPPRPDDYRVRAYRPGDETAILDLFRRAFHVERSAERWRWAYADNPYGHHRISLAVDGDGRIVAHYAGYPVRVWCGTGDGAGGESWECQHVGDTMTDPEVRGVGRGTRLLLTRTVRHFYDTWCTGKVAFNFGVNTGKIQRFSRRTAGALRLEDVVHRVRPLTGGAAWPAPGRLARRLVGWRVERVGDFDDRFDAFFARVRGAYRFLVERDRRYLAWRYGAFPEEGVSAWAVSRRGRLVGWSVLRRQEERLVWGDALFDPSEPEAPGLLLAEATAAAEHQGAQAIEGWFPERPAWWDERLRALGFEQRPEPQDLGVVYVPFEVEPGERMRESLYYTKGDFDLF